MRYVVFSVMVLLSVALLPFLPAAKAEASQVDVITLLIAGERVQPEVPPQVVNGRTLVPIRVIAEGLGADVQWDQATRTAIITRAQNRVELTLNHSTALLNGKQVKLDAPPLLQQERMLLPLRFVGEALGATVGWEERTRTVVVNEPVTLLVNGENLSAVAKVYQIDNTVYLPLVHITEKLGLTADWATVAEPKVIDSATVVPLREVKRIIEDAAGGEVHWDISGKQLHIKRISYLEDVKVHGTTVQVETSAPVTPRHFVLANPHRIVFDLPATVLSKKLAANVSPRDALGTIEFEGAVANPDEAAKGDDTISAREKSDEGAAASQPPSWLFADAEWTSYTQASDVGEEMVSLRQADLSAQPLIKQIRYSQFSESPYTVRVVLELNQKSAYTVTPVEDGFTVQLTPAPRKTGFLIVVDAGHGGHDPGAIGVAGNREKDFNLAVATRVVELLKQYPEFQPVATRSSDVFLELADRVALANEYNADLFISIHANSFSNANTRGTETYYYNEHSEAFARIVHKHLVQATGFPDRRMRQYPFYVIKHTKMPAVLTETGFLTNPTENALLIDPQFQEKVARALVAAIREYYDAYHE